MKLSRYVLFFFPFFLLAMEIGNPAQPALQKSGLILEEAKKWSFRLAYLDDYVYRMRFKDEFDLTLESTTPTFVKLATNAGLITLNLFDRIDAYTILGTSQLQIQNEAYTKREFSWGVGGKLLFAKLAKMSFGVDIKYFTTKQTPIFFLSDGYAYNVVNDYKLNYSEIQGSLGTSYKTKYISPYLQITYLISKLKPQPLTALVQYPLDSTISIDAESRPAVGQRRWGMAVGATLLGSPKATLTVESRFINQNAIDINGEFRF